jgi:hypothetical protein
MRRDEELEKELRFHVDQRVADAIAAGMTPEEARRQAALEFGGVIQVKEAIRDQHRWRIANGCCATSASRFARCGARPSSR